VRRARPGAAGRPAVAPGTVHPVDAGDPPVQTVHRVPAILRCGRVLADLCSRWPHAALARRARPPSRRTCRVTHFGGPILLNRRGGRMDRHAATPACGAWPGHRPAGKIHPHVLRHTFVTTILTAARCAAGGTSCLLGRA
jgi:integrase